LTGERGGEVPTITYERVWRQPTRRRSRRRCVLRRWPNVHTIFAMPPSRPGATAEIQPPKYRVVRTQRCGPSRGLRQVPGRRAARGNGTCRQRARLGPDRAGRSAHRLRKWGAKSRKQPVIAATAGGQSIEGPEHLPRSSHNSPGHEGAPGRTRTCDARFRKPSLNPFRRRS
jgi:hypothetical protein